MSYDDRVVGVLSSSEGNCSARKEHEKDWSEIKLKESVENYPTDIKSLMRRYTTLCCYLQNTREMFGLVNDILLPLFDNAKEEYLHSDPFYKLIHKLTVNMETTREFAFTNLKKVILNLKAHQKPNVADKNNDIECIELDESSEQSNAEAIDLVSNNLSSKKRKASGQLGEAKKKRVAFNTISKNIDGVGNLAEYDRGTLLNKERLSVSYDEVVETEKGSESVLDLKVKSLENKISNCVEKIKKYERLEVDLDNPRSVYIKCDRLKAKILTLYEEIMKIKKCEPEYKRVVVKLAVPHGQPSGPARRLEAWINKDVTCSFPDFHDVVRCVATANIEDDLGWTHKQILSESRKLFRNCGEQLQKRRQEREWRYLRDVSFDFDNDPADADAELRAKLEGNMIIAKNNEKRVVDMFADAEAVVKYKNNVSISFDTKESKLVFISDTEEAATVADDQSECSHDSDDEQFQFVKSDNNLLLVKTEDNYKGDMGTFNVGDEDLCNGVEHSVTILFDSSSDED